MDLNVVISILCQSKKIDQTRFTANDICFFFDNFKTLLSKDFVQRKSGPKNLFANVNTTSSDWTDIATI